ncbi:alpha-amylase family glycosyl hydrolase [Bradyrhizobium pachyrhizi]|uniref:alpha-amylase family glycosyl hydrolase n=1 Tax=Bradyrhizobium pachyrhizi TaxID=280333 RepID=UPI001FCDC293|nr:alpha-amylase family glycosyl hydrolase [Bradyrhizobium pachyrhizi]
MADLCSGDPRFGKLEDVDNVLRALHDSGIRLILDLVPNHTSDQHAWFAESRASRDNPKADW